MVDVRRLKLRIKHFFKSLSRHGAISLGCGTIVVLAIIIGVVLYIKYKNSPKTCFPQLCDQTTVALGCNPATFNANCINPKQIKFTDVLKRTFLEAINQYRNAYAGNMMGRSYYKYDENAQTGGYAMCNIYKPTDRPPCARCAVIQWDNDLAALGELAVKSCKPGLTYCINTLKFPNAGWLEVFTPACRYAYFLSRVVKQWAFIDNRYNVTVEYFMLTNEKLTHIGCGMATMGKPNISLYLACFFSYAENTTGYLRDSPNFSDRGGSRCTTGVDFRYRNLCSLDEEILPQIDRTLSFVDLNDSEVPYGKIHVESQP